MVGIERKTIGIEKKLEHLEKEEKKQNMHLNIEPYTSSGTSKYKYFCTFLFYKFVLLLNKLLNIL